MRRLGVLACSAAVLVGSLQVRASTYTVNDVGDAGDATPGDDSCATAGAVCTLRAAIEEANSHVGADTIEFSIAGTEPHKISATGANLTITGRKADSEIAHGPSGRARCRRELARND